jgi:hypothetical protein
MDLFYFLFSPTRIYIPTFPWQCQDVATKQRLSPHIAPGVTQCLEELRSVRPLMVRKVRTDDWSQGHRVGQLPGQLWQRLGGLCQPVPGGDFQGVDRRDGWCRGLWSSNVFQCLLHTLFALEGSITILDCLCRRLIKEKKTVTRCGQPPFVFRNCFVLHYITS